MGLPDAAWAIMRGHAHGHGAVVRSVTAAAGRAGATSSLAGSMAASGPSQKNRIRKMESARRIWNSCYTKNGRSSIDGAMRCARSGIIGVSSDFIAQSRGNAGV